METKILFSFITIFFFSKEIFCLNLKYTLTGLNGTI
ncbi:unnamed protein product, partial [Brachionus calyciflorus]